MMFEILFVVTMGTGPAVAAEAKSIVLPFLLVTYSGKQHAPNHKQYANCSVENTLLLYSSYFPQDCLNAAQTLDFSKVRQVDPREVAKFGEIACNPRCGDPLFRYTQTVCPTTEGQNLLNQLIQLCAQNSQGKHCYSASVASYYSSIITYCTSSVCTSSCRSSVQTAITAIGCCVNVLVNDADQVEDACVGNLPQPCSGSTISSGAVAPYMGFTTGVFSLFLTISALY